MTTLRKTDGTLSSNILETMNIILDHLITDDEEEVNQHDKNIRKMTKETIYISDKAEFTQGEIKQTTGSFNRKKLPGMDGITNDIFQRTFNKFPRIVISIYNQCLKRGSFLKTWKTANIIPIAKPAKKAVWIHPNTFK